MKLPIFTVAILVMAFVHGAAAMSLDRQWYYSVAHIANESTEKAGTGFFVFRETTNNKGRIFLVSNKHVLIPVPLKDPSNQLAEAVVTITTESDEQLSLTSFKIRLRSESGQINYLSHPSDTVDVAAVDVTADISEGGSLRKGYKVGFINEIRFATKESIEETKITIGDPITILGYPLNMVEGNSAIAVARGGVIASPPDRDYRGEQVFLIDCATIRGSSGSPVFVPLRPFKLTDKPDGGFTVNMGGYVPTLLGIVSRTVPDWELVLKKTEVFGAPPTTISVVDTANFGIVFRAETISQVLDLSGIPRTSKKGQTTY
jgi:hypothetical protein